MEGIRSVWHNPNLPPIRLLPQADGLEGAGTVTFAGSSGYHKVPPKPTRPRQSQRSSTTRLGHGTHTTLDNLFAGQSGRTLHLCLDGPALLMTKPRMTVARSFPTGRTCANRSLDSWNHPVRKQCPKPVSYALGPGYNTGRMDAMNQPNIMTMQDILSALAQDPSLQHQLHRLLVEAIRKNDDLRQDLRKEILSEELLQLPTRFTRLEGDVAELKHDVTEVKHDVAELKHDMAEVKHDVAELKHDVAEVKHDVAELKHDVAELKHDMAEVKHDVAEVKHDVAELKHDTTRMAGQIANLMGSDYETQAIEGSRRLIRRALDMERATLVYASRKPADDFEAHVLVPAIRQGLINRRQADQLEEADSIIRCENDQGDVIHAVVEISITVQDHDRTRATDRAEIFKRATGFRSRPFVVGQNEAQRGANVPDVPFLAYPE